MLHIILAVAMSFFYIIIPEATTNYCLNPSAETTGNFAAAGAATVTRSTTYSHYGLYSYRVETSADNEGITLTLSALDNAIHYVTMRVRGTLPTTWDWSLDNANWNTPASEETLGDWTLYGYEFPAAQANGSTTLYIHQNGAGSGDFYIDGIQVEQTDDYYTTYCDGDQDGCEWDGSEHGSTSSRSALAMSGGRVRDVEDYYLYVEELTGFGSAPITVHLQEYAVLPGAAYQSRKTHPAVRGITGLLTDGTFAGMHDNRKSLIDAFKPAGIKGDEPVVFRYTGGTTVKETGLYYEGGFEYSGGLKPYERPLGLRFVSTDPYWYAVGEESTVLDTSDTITLRYCGARLKDTGQWSDLSLSNNPTTGGRTNVVTIGSDGKVYFGGNFTGHNGVANRDYIARYDPVADTWDTVGGAAALNGDVEAIVNYPDGRLLVGGNFTNAGGDANADYIAFYDPSTDAFSALAGGGTGPVRNIIVSRDNTLYLGGSFLNWDGDANADWVVSWTSAGGYAPLDQGLNAMVRDLGETSDGTIWAVGWFTAGGGGTTLRYVGTWDGSSWSEPGGGFDSLGEGIEIASNGDVYVAGNFTATGDGSVTGLNYVARYNGQVWQALGSGANAIAYRVHETPDGTIIASGNFTEIGDIEVADKIGKWNGYSWAHLDIDLPGSPIVRSVETSDADPVIPSNYDLWIGFDTTGSATISGSTTITNNGSTIFLPIITVERSGGSTATLTNIRNETTGKELLFEYDLLDGEKITIDLRPTKQKVTSTFFGARWDALLENSDVSDFEILPGDNTITCLVQESGAPTLTAAFKWRVPYDGFDD